MRALPPGGCHSCPYQPGGPRMSDKVYIFEHHEGWRLNYDPVDRRLMLVNLRDEELGCFDLPLEQVPEVVRALRNLAAQESTKSNE